MEEWKGPPVATCEALVNSMPKSVKAVLGKNGGQTKYSSQVKSKFISIAHLKTTELHQSAVQQIQYNKNSL